MEQLKAVILAAGKGTRMKSDLPKVVHTIEGKCLVDYAIEAAIGAGAEDICLVVGYKYEVVRETILHQEVNFVLQEEQLGTGHAVRCAKDFLGDEGQKQIRKNIAYYQENAAIIAKTMEELGIEYTGGKNSPYIWLKCPNGMKSWEFFDYLLHEAAVVGTPGEGFGKNGEGWFRLTAFGDRDKTKEAMDRMKKLLAK